jgi:4-amino-4-deoxy-L-arabinose transferase-like glycosyltransferase
MDVQSLRARFAGAAQDRVRRFLMIGALVIIVVGALILRLYAVGWGLPYVDHPDEPSAANTVLGMLRRGDWDPHFFKKPSLYYYALRIVFEAHWRYGLAKGLYSDMAQLPLGTYYYVTTPGFFVWGRTLTALFGVATLFVINDIGRRWWGAAVGLSAAGVLAVLPFHVRNSQFLTVDVPTGLMTALALAAALRLLDDRRWRAYALAGLLTGFAASTKYPAASVALAVVLAHGLRLGRISLSDFWRLPWAMLWSLIGFLIATPYALITPGAFLNGVLKQYGDYNTPGGDLFRRWPVAGYLNFFWSDGLLPLPCIAVLIGAFVVVRRRDRAGLVMIGFALPYLLFVLAQHKHFFRNLMPIFPVLVLLAGIGIAAAASYALGWIARLLTTKTPSHQGSIVNNLSWSLGALVVKSTLLLRQRSLKGSAPKDATPIVGLKPDRGIIAGTLLLTAVVAIHPLINTITLDRLFAQPHSKVRAGDYVREHLPRGAPIAMALNPVAWPDEPMLTLTEDVAEHDADWYRAQGYRYLVGNVRDDVQRYAELRAQARVLAAFEGELDGRPSPHMEVLDLGLRLDRLAIERRETVFGDKLRLLGFQFGAGKLRAVFSPLVRPKSVRPGHALQFNLYWQPLAKIEKDYAIFLHLLDAQGRVVAQRDTLIRGYDYPTSRWQPGELAVDLADMYIPPEVPEGMYRLEIGVYDMQTMARLPIADGPSGAKILMEIQVRGKA